MRKTDNKLNSLPDRVEYILEKDKYSRDNDFHLWGELCQLFYPPFERPIYSYREIAALLSKLPSLNHIARARRIATERTQNYYPEHWEVAKDRGMNRKAWLNYARKHDIPTTPQELTAKLQRESAGHSNIPAGYDDEGRPL